MKTARPSSSRRPTSIKEAAQNDLGEMTLASPAVSGNALFIRTEKRLYRIE